MPISARSRQALAALACAAIVAVAVGLAMPPVVGAQKGAEPFALTVDSIMRGPKLVGYPPTGLRWVGRFVAAVLRVAPSRRRRSVDVGRRRATAARLAEAVRRGTADRAAVGGTWDAARRRVLFVDSGDIVMVDSVAGTRRQITRTTGD